MRISLPLLLLAAGCAVNLGSSEGIVVDSTTGKGLAGAFVVSSWYFHGADTVGSRTSCVDAVVVRADSDGRYRLPPAPLGLGLDSEVFAYVPSYEDDPGSGYDEKRQVLRPFGGSAERRIEQMRRLSGLRSCVPTDKLSSRLSALYEVLDVEVDKLQFKTPQLFSPGYFMRALRAAEKYGRPTKESNK